MSHAYPEREHLPSSLDLAYGRHILDQQHGPYLVALYLEQLGLADWTGRVMGYLRMYDGIESWLEPGDIEAVDFVRQLLFKEVHRKAKEDVSALQYGTAGTVPSLVVHRKAKEDVSALRFRLAVAMANAPVASYGAAFKIQRNLDDPMQSIWWDPLEQTWLSFLARRETLPDYTRLYLSGPCEFRASAQSLIEYLNT